MVTYQEQDFRPYMSDVEKYNSDLLALNDQWDNIKLLCEINCPEHAKDILSSMANIQNSFSDLQKKLVSTLISEKLNKLEQKTISKAQVAVDILIRNLYERTADVGFLATDDDIRRFVGSEERSEQDREHILKRLRGYVAKYSVYEEIIILDRNFTVLANLDSDNKILGTRIDDPLLQQTINSSESFVESFKTSPLQAGKEKAHIFSQKIVDENTGKILGAICLCFRFENEMAGIFKKLSIDYDGSVLMIIDEHNRVIASSDDSHIPVGIRIEPVTDGKNGIVYYRGIEYISKTVCTNGYQGYYGLGWKGHIMIPLKLAFKEKTTKLLDSIDHDIRTGLMNQADSFSKDLNEIMDRTLEINKSLRRIVYNGQIIAKDGNVDEEYIRLKPLLNYINKIGTNIGRVFRDSDKNLFATVVSTSLRDNSFIASLCIDIMDRNLYERADDCRWWARNSTFKTILAHNDITEQDTKKLTEILKYINSLYTVYSNLFLFDKSGKIIAVSSPEHNGDIGKVLNEAYIKNILSNSSEAKYFVSKFEKTELYDGRYTYIYGASITDINSCKSTVGGIGIVFDSEFQFKAMLDDSIQGKENAFAVFADRKGTIISSTNEELHIGDELKLPRRLLDVQNGDSYSEIFVHDGAYYSVGCVCSSSYREYKSSDGYKNDVLAIVFEKLADYEKSDVLHKKNKFLEQSDIPVTSSGKITKMATFFIDGRLLALEQGVVVEAIEADNLTPIPECSDMVRGVVKFRKQYVTVLDTHFLFKHSSYDNKVTCVLIVKLAEDSLVGLVVDQLNNVLEINENAIRPVPEMGGSTAIVKGAACFEKAGGRMLLVLDEKKLLNQLSPEIEKIDMEKLVPLIENQAEKAKEIAED